MRRHLGWFTGQAPSTGARDRSARQTLGQPLRTSLAGFLGTLWAWSMGVLCVAINYWGFVSLFSHSLVVGAFMAAVGVRSSLSSPTATRAMTITMGFWLAAYGAFAALAGIITFILILFGVLFWALAVALGLMDRAGAPTFHASWVAYDRLSTPFAWQLPRRDDDDHLRSSTPIRSHRGPSFGRRDGGPG